MISTLRILNICVISIALSIFNTQVCNAANNRPALQWRQAWKTLKNFIPRHIDNPSARLKEVQSMELFVSASFKQPSHTIRIDIMEFVHGTPFDVSLQLEQETKASDKKVLVLLNRLGQDSVGVEGSYCEQLTLHCVIEDISKRVYNTYGFIPSKASILRTLEEYRTGQPWITYLQKNPSIPMTGLNDSFGLDELHAYLIELDLGGKNERAVLDVRTDIGIARMIVFMQKRKLRHGVVLFGKRHTERAKALLGQLNIKSTTY